MKRHRGIGREEREGGREGGEGDLLIFLTFIFRFLLMTAATPPHIERIEWGDGVGNFIVLGDKTIRVPNDDWPAPLSNDHNGIWMESEGKAESVLGLRYNIFMQ